MARSYIPVEIERRVRNAARNRCGYCLSPQYLGLAEKVCDRFHYN